MLEHGGQLRQAARRWGRPLGEWLDLSTGINPRGYPVPDLDPECWRRLPEEDDGLEAAARECYGAPSLLPVPGSQVAIQLLPRLFAPGDVLMLTPAYNEHAAAWRRCGHKVAELPTHEVEAQLEQAAAACHCVVLARPNNPTGTLLPAARLLALAERLGQRGGALVCDEAFIDATPGLSLAAEAWRPGLVVLRSLGKFYGLAGARVGFVCAADDLLLRLREELGPWMVSGPARAVARQALADRAWQQAARARLEQDGARLGALLGRLGPTQGTALFRWLPHARAAALHQELARRGILVRLFDQPPSLRFGLPGTEAEWLRLQTALEEIAHES